MTEHEYVVLLDDRGVPCGEAAKSAVHSTATPLHLAFSCWLVDRQGRTLVTRRAAGKLTWPSVWTNSFCGHPAPGEAVGHAVARRGRQELGIEVRQLRVVLPEFRYTARMANGMMENEICPVYVAETDSVPGPDEAEVDALAWVEWAALVDDVAADPARFSPWLRLQLPQLLATGLAS